MATQAAVERWDKVLDAVEKTRQSWLIPEAMTPEVRKHQYKRDLPMIVETVFSQFMHAWQTDRPGEGSDLHAVLEPVARAIAAPLDFTQAALPQVDPMMVAVAEARNKLGGLGSMGSTAAEIVGDIELLLKVTVLVARVSHQGSMKIVDDELQARFQAINRNEARGAKYFDVHSFRAVDRPSATTISMQVILAMVDPGISTWEERMNPFPEESYPTFMKQFAAQWVVTLYTEWEEHFRQELADALSCPTAAVSCDYFGDLGKMRHDYVHNRGICKNSARNVLLKWYHPGDTMIPKHANYLQLLTDFPRAELLTPKPVVDRPQRQPVKAKVDPELRRRFESTADQVGIGKDKALEQALQSWVATQCEPGSSG